MSTIWVWEIYRGEPATLHPALETVEGRAEDLGFGVLHLGFDGLAGRPGMSEASFPSFED